ncbi:hypothetical protein [Helicobacter heilmannii]|uniref:Uncharacterized protein n=1 Tax=Helicobacter heilmannii TaxID=35817 RepID=A0A0K2YAG6_HELHE|nr:hypothetical protein [Helicobacter heilmannii]BDQ27446.1 hypothetical protein ASB1_11220 [Helicobacter heilmannii]CCM11852.1 hypothetical protein BN341_2000 [Helicobacter heilmannii ASB1.4]CRI33990.1 hypothetical protein HHE01_16760 [Helicobacter heilmannii]
MRWLGGGVGLQGLSIGLGLANLDVGIWATDKQLQQADKQMKLAQRQFEEVCHYNARENECLSANKTIGESVQLYNLNPMERA